MRTRQISLHIEDLVLDGFASADGIAIADAVKDEISRLLSERELPASLMGTVTRSTITAPPVQLQPSSTPAHAGKKIGKAIYQGMHQ